MPAICLSWNCYLLGTPKKQDSRMFAGCFQKFLTGKHVIIIGESPHPFTAIMLHLYVLRGLLYLCTTPYCQKIPF